MQAGESGAESAVDTSEDLIGEGNEPEIKAVEPVIEPEQKPEPNDIDEDAGDDSSEEVKKKRRGGFKKKIEARDAEISRLNAELAKHQSPQQKSTETPSKKPLPADYQTYDDYVDALTDFKADQATKKILGERDNQIRESDAVREHKTKVQAYEAKTEDARKLYADYDEAIAEYDDVPVSPVVTAALVDSDMGPEVAYYLAKNPDEFDKINKPGIGILEVNKAIGRIEARIELGRKSEKAAVKTTKAPQPIVPIKGSAVSPKNLSDDDVDYEEYRRLRGYN